VRDGISASELDLLTFFEVEPAFVDAKDPWPYTDALYEITRGELALSFAVAPAYKDVRIILRHGDQQVYELNAVGVNDVRYHNDSGRESLEIVFANDDACS
jgi:hypothetical protein